MSRRSLIRLLGGTGIALGLTACGGSGPAGGLGGAAGVDGFPVTVPHSLGETVIEAPPSRVVALGYSDADAVLALGVQPVGIRSAYFFEAGVGPWAAPKLTGPPPVVWRSREFDYEAIAALGPDLILDISDSGEQAPYDLLSKIAPTVALPRGAVRYASTWQDTTRLAARALGLSARGEELVTATEAYLARIAADNPRFAGRTLTYLDVYPGGVAVGGEPAKVVQTLHRLGFVQPPALRGAEWGKSQNPISAELLTRVEADVLLIHGFGSDLQRVLATYPSLAALPAVRAGRVHVLPDLSLGSPSVLSIPYGVDRVLPELRRMLA